MAKWTNAGKRTYDNLGIVLERLFGGFLGISLGAQLCRDFPSAAGLLSMSAMFLAFIFIVLAHSRSRKSAQGTA